MPDSDASISRDGVLGIRLRVEAGDGASADEVVAVRPLAGSRYTVHLSPGFYQGIAAGDEIAYDPMSKTAQVVSRGGNIAVQCFHEGIPKGEVEVLKRRAAEIGGRVDGEMDTLVVLTFPARVGFPAIESLMATFRSHGVEWEYGNVYDEAGNSLGWRE
ncbi:DUF4265 domain-containing protein [Streptomyces sp. NPDC001296]